METKKQPLITKLLPIILSVAVIILDQVTKALVVKYIPLLNTGDENAVIKIWGDFIRLIHVRNPAVAFSIGASFSRNARAILFSIIPLFVIIVVYIIYFRNNDFTKLQRWAICGILGGGIGNLIDRFFRPDGVVDFIDVIFPKALIKSGRWPTFNVADSAVVICGILFIVSIIIQIVQDKNKKTAKAQEPSE